MLDPGKIFSGNAPSDNRRYLIHLLKFLREQRGVKQVVIPCCGQFACPKCAIAAGFDPAVVYSSDISVFSSILGYLYAGRPLETLPITLLPGPVDLIVGQVRPQEEYEALETDLDRAAYLMWLLKIAQMSPQKEYLLPYLTELLRQPVLYRSRVRDQLDEFSKHVAGIHYDIADMRDVIQVGNDDPGTVFIMNPSAFTKGYTRMFQPDRFLKYDAQFEEFDAKKERLPMYLASREMEALFIWGKGNQELQGIPDEDILYAKEYWVGKAHQFQFWLITKPWLLEGFEPKPSGAFLKTCKLRPYKKAGIWGMDDELRPDTKVTMVRVDKDVALYYRDLFAHKLGVTQAEGYGLILLDGKVFATIGLFFADLFMLRSEYVYEVYGFSAPSQRHWNINRLMMWLITCAEFRDFVLYTSKFCQRNRIYHMRGLRTTCLSRYRDVKVNRRILQCTSCERQKNGMYMTKWQADWRPETYSEALARYLAERELHGARKPAAAPAAD